jgi:hypothetical protein
MNEPLCKYLRTKKLFIPEHAEQAFTEEHEHGAEAFFWCNRTLTNTGIDDQPVHVRVCTRGRCCYEE